MPGRLVGHRQAPFSPVSLCAGAFHVFDRTDPGPEILPAGLPFIADGYRMAAGRECADSAAS